MSLNDKDSLGTTPELRSAGSSIEALPALRHRIPNKSSTSGTATPMSADEIEVGLDGYAVKLGDEWWGIDPLPDEKFPRVVEKRDPSQGYWIAMGLVMAVWMVTPLSCAYLVWFVLIGQGLGGGHPGGLTATLFAAYALTEVVFAIYMAYLIRFVQVPAPASTLPLETRNELFRRILRSDLTYSRPSRPGPSADPEVAMERELFKMYEGGHLTPAEYHHLKDRDYEEIHGIRQGSRRRVGKMTKVDADLIEAFVEEVPGDREARLRAQIEQDVGYGQDDFNEDGLFARDGTLTKLHPMDRRAVEFRERLRTWFNHAPWESIRRNNMLIWLSWTCFGLPYEDAQRNEKWNEFLEHSLELLEARTGTTFPEGFNGSIELMRLTLDPVNAKHRPLILYALSNCVNWYLREVVYPYQGMGLYREDDIDYLVRIPNGWSPEKGRTEAASMPIVYFHGLGFGLLQNHLLIKHLVSTLASHPIVVPLSPHTSQSIFHERHLRPSTKEETVQTIKKICTKWGFWKEGKMDERSGRKRGGWGGVSLLSHSNGSVAHSWILKDCPELSKRNTFVDPVVFVMWEGDICHSFCYRKPATALELLLYYFIASEVGIANYIQRNFDWADNNLFCDEIPNLKDPSRTAFFLGAHDIIIDAARARRYLEKHGVKGGLHWDKNAGHGDGLAGEARDRVIRFVSTGSV